VARFGGTEANAAWVREQGAEAVPTVALPGTVYEQVLRSQQPDTRRAGAGARLIVPVTDRGDTIGVLELPWYPDDDAVAEIADAARTLAYVVVACRRHTDLYVHAALLATVLVGSLRNSRRRDIGLVQQAAIANEALAAHSPVGDFVTGQLVRVDLAAAEMSIVNAGHPIPFRVRDGRVEELDLSVDMPFGIEPGRAFTVQRIALEPGDRIVLVTDGMLERNAEDLDVAAALGRTAQRHPREVVYVLGEAVLHATEQNLRDDATVVCLDWNGGPVAGPDGTPVARPV
jgi:hypothetical protein